MQWLLCRSLRGFALTVPVTRRHFSLLMPQELLLPGAAVRLEIVEQREMKDTGASALFPESGNTPSGGIFVFHYLFRRGKPWYTERNESKGINREVPL